jgi:alpha-amylase
MGTREELRDLINTCRGFGVRVYIDAVLNHFTGAGNDMLKHRNPNGCVTWGNKTSSAPPERQSPFYTHAFTFEDNMNTGLDPSNEFPAAAIGTDDFHCDRALNTWTDLFILNNGWLVGLTDIDTSKDNVRERQSAYLVDMLSLGASGFRFDAAKHVSPQDLSGILKKVQTKMGGQLPDDFFVWLEVLTGKIISIYHFLFCFFPKVEKLILFGKDHHGMVLCLKVFLNKILARIQKLIKLK